MLTSGDFMWPCEKERPHGPHPYDHDRDGHDCAPEMCGGSRNDPCSIENHCPGVRAHPLTQIGKGELEMFPRKPVGTFSARPKEPLKEGETFSWPSEVTQEVPSAAWDIKYSKVYRLKQGDWVRLTMPGIGECEYIIVSIDHETRTGTLRRAGS